MNNFNVAKDEWMPVLDKNGKFSYISPIQLFSGDYESFAGDEIQNYVMMLFCETVVHSSEGCQPTDIIEWREMKSIFAEKAVMYLKDNIDLFWMRGDKPFLQCNKDDFNNITNNKGKPIKEMPIRLRNQLSSNAAVLRTTPDRYNNWRDVTLDLIVQQTFWISFASQKGLGLSPSKLFICDNNSYISKELRSGNVNIYLTSNTIIDSVYYNLLHSVENYSGGYGRPVWETRFTSDPLCYLSQLIPLNVKIWISDDMNHMMCSSGLNYIDNNSNNSHMLQTTYKKGDDTIIRPLRVDKNFKFWKEFNAYFNKTDRDRVHQLSSNRVKNVDILTLNTIGCIFSNNNGNFDIDTIESSCYNINYPKKLESDLYKTLYSTCISTVQSTMEKVHNSLIGVKTSDDKYINAENKKQFKALIWKYLDEHSFELFEYSDMTDLKKWKKILFDACETALNWVGYNYGYLAQYKISESQNWYQLKKSLTENA